MIDLRSDTVAHPTEGMLAAMVTAPLGDDVLGDDPTVKQLERRMAELTGKESALFVASGTMANLLALRVNTQPGDEVILHETAHPMHYEAGGAAHVAGVMLATLGSAKGLLDPDEVAARVRPTLPHVQPTSLLWVEDTANRGGGAVHPLERLDALSAVARRHGLRTHLDGARQWHAAEASGVPIARRVAGYDTVSLCFSKGLGCPVGSILCGTAADMAREVDMLRSSDRRAKLVLNRMFPKKRFRAEFAVDKAEKAIDRKIDATITSDWDAARTAVNLGKPIADVKPKSALVADVSALVDLMMPAGALQPAQQQTGRKAK